MQDFSMVGGEKEKGALTALRCCAYSLSSKRVVSWLSNPILAIPASLAYFFIPNKAGER